MSTKMCFSEVVAFKNKYLKQNFIPKSKTLKRLLTWKIEFYKSWIPPNIVVFKILFPSRVEKLVFNKKTFNSCRLKKKQSKFEVLKSWCLQNLKTSSNFSLKNIMSFRIHIFHKLSFHWIITFTYSGLVFSVYAFIRNYLQ